MVKGWRRQVLATESLRINGHNRTFDEFLDEQRVRVMNQLHPPINEDPITGHYYEQGQHPRAAMNDGWTRARIHQEAEQELRGNCCGANGRHRTPDDQWGGADNR